MTTNPQTNDMLLHTCIIYILRFLAGVNGSQWSQVLELVKVAEKDLEALTTGDQRKAWVMGQLRSIAPKLGQWALDLIVGLAAGYAGRKGWIHLSK